MMVKFNCVECNAEFWRYPSGARTAKFCSKDCKTRWQRVNFRGEANPNYGGGGWSDESKAKNSARMKERMAVPELRAMSAANKGRVFSEETRLRMSEAHKRYYEQNEPVPHTAEIRALIGRKSSAKFTPEYNEKVRAHMVELGHWRAEVDIPDIEKHYKASNWIRPMWDLANDADKQRLFLAGTWHYHFNKEGLVRDHAYSRSSGFRANVPPIIMRHPANLRLISHGENVSKEMSKSSSHDSVTLDELLRAIDAWTGEWFEQQDCIEAVAAYRISRKVGGS